MQIERGGALQRPLHRAVGARAVDGLQLQAAEFEAAGVDVGLARLAQLQHALCVERGAPGRLLDLPGQAQGQSLGWATGLQLERAEVDLLCGRGVGGVAGGHLARDTQARGVQASLQARCGGRRGARGRCGIAQGAQPALPRGVEAGTALGQQAGLGIERCADLRAHHRQGLQAAHPGEQAAGVREVQVELTVARGVRGLALPGGLGAGHLHRDIAFKAARTGVVSALGVERGVGGAQARRAQFEHTLRGVVCAGAPAPFHVQFAQPHTVERAGFGLHARGLHAGADVDGRACRVGIDRARAHVAVERGGRDAAPELGGVEAAGLDVALPCAQGRGLRAGGRLPLALALQAPVAQLRVQPRERPARAALFQLGLQPVQRQALPVGRAAGAVGQAQLGAPGVTVGLRLHGAAELRDGGLRPEGGQVDPVQGGVGGFNRLWPPRAQAGLGVERGGIGRGRAAGGFHAGGRVQCRVGGGQGARDPGDGFQHHALAARYGGGHLAAGVHAQGHGGLRAEQCPHLVAATGDLRALQVELVRVGHAEVPGAVGCAVAVQALEVTDRDGRSTRHHQLANGPGQRHRQRQRDGLQGLGRRRG